MMKSSIRKLIFVVLPLLHGCISGPNYAPVIERKERAQTVPKVHIVKPGDTLYSIAWYYNTEVNRLAHANNLTSPYLIFPGQKIALKQRSAPVKNAGSKLPAKGSNMLNKSKKQSTNSDKLTPAKAKPQKTGKTSRPNQIVQWQWPARGELARAFSVTGGVHKGIDIKGKLGEPVHAASSGRVVYAGSGLVGYGKLLIIKHNEYYLSAYGHNRKLLVAEGESVKGGQRIAEIGDTGTDKVKLHFEIRRNGKPVDPLKLLPRGR